VQRIAEVQPVEAANRACKHCGTEAEEGSAFCENCGQSLD
jgi:RNA polymerase subunit RPABC4/transcription elongation factor Spt4